MEQSISIIQDYLIKTAAFLPQIATAIIVLIFMTYMGRLAGNIFLRFLQKSDLSSTHRNFFRKIIIWLFVLIGISISLNILNLNAASMGLLTGGGITALAIGIAFRDIGENILAGIYLAFSKPFKKGDLISSGDLEGVVQEVELRHTHIRTYDGTDIFIPNAKIFNEPLQNFTRDGLRRYSFVIGIDYFDDALKACSILLPEIQKIKGVLNDPPCITSISGFTPQYVELKIYFWINSFDKSNDYWHVKNTIMDCCRKILKDNNFTFSSNVQTSNVISVPDRIEVKNLK